MIRFAIIGCGYIGTRHIDEIGKMPQCEVVAMCDIKTGDNTQEIPNFSSVEKMFESGIDFDIVCICTPNHLHAQHAQLALQHGKHVIIEKPMGLTVEECEKVIEMSLINNKHVFCVMQNRYSPPIKWLKELLSENHLGEIYSIQTNCFWNRNEGYYHNGNHPWKGKKETDGGTLFTQFSHFVDIMYWLFGDLSIEHFVSGNFKHPYTDFEDTGTFIFRTKTGAICNMLFSTAVYGENFESTMVIIGEKGTVKIGGQYMNELQYCNIENYPEPVLPKSRPANDYGSYKGSASNHDHIFKNVVEVMGGEQNITTNALEGLKVVDIIRNIYKHENT